MTNTKGRLQHLACGIALASCATIAAAQSASAPSAASAGAPRAASNEAQVAQVRKAADQGDANAIELLGEWTFDGTHGIEKDVPAAVDLLVKAAGRGSHRAGLAMGNILLNGWGGVKRNDRIAVEWMGFAAEKGNPHAAVYMATFFEEGRVVDRDDATALSWLQRASRAGEGHAQQFLAKRYHEGRGVAADPVRAAAWAIVAAGTSDGAENPTLKDELLRPLDERQRAQAESLARTWHTGSLLATDGPAVPLRAGSWEFGWTLKPETIPGYEAAKKSTPGLSMSVTSTIRRCLSEADVADPALWLPVAIESCRFVPGVDGKILTWSGSCSWRDDGKVSGRAVMAPDHYDGTTKVRMSESVDAEAQVTGRRTGDCDPATFRK